MPIANPEADAKSNNYKNKDWLKTEYLEKDRTQQDIAEECGVCRMTINNWVEKHEIRKTNSKTATFAINGDQYAHWQCKAGDKIDYVSVHRLLATLKVDDLSELENKHVHHQSGHPRDNRPENLEILTPAEHLSRHAKK